MCRHCRARGEMFKRIKDGAIGDLTMMRAYRMAGRTAKESSPRKPAERAERADLADQAVPLVPVGQRRVVQRFSDPQHRRMLLDEGRLAGEGAGHRRPALSRRQRRSEFRQLLGRVHVRRRRQAVPRTAARSTAATASIPATCHGTKGSAHHFESAATCRRSAGCSRTRT